MKRPTIKDIAVKAKVSPATVSRAINNNSRISKDTIKRVKEIAHELGYEIDKDASNLAKGNGVKRVGIFINDINEKELENSININVIYHATKKFQEFNIEYEIILDSAINNSDKNFIERKCRVRRYSDIIVFGLRDNPSILSKLDNISTNIILIDVDYRKDNINCVMVNNYEAQHHLTLRAIEKHSLNHILYIAGDTRAYVAKERLKGFEKAARDLNIKSTIVYGDFSMDFAQRFCEENDITQYDSIMCSCDIAMCGVIKYLKKNNLKKTVCGFDGSMLPKMFDYPYLTVKQNIENLMNNTVSMIKQGDYRSDFIEYRIIEHKVD